MDIFSLFKPKQKPVYPPDTLDEVINYTKSLIVREDLIRPLLDRLHSEVAPQKNQRLRLYSAAYFALEEFIVRNKPMIVQRTFTKESLRQEIRERFALQTLPEEFRLIFLPPPEQSFLLYIGFTRVLSEYIIKQIGINGLLALLNSVTHDTPFADLNIQDEQSVRTVYQHLPDIPASELTALFQKINTRLYQHIATSFGSNSALELIQTHYQNIKDLYNYDLISNYLQSMPPGVLDREKVAYMTRDDLEKQAMIAAEEKLRREMAEKSAKSLEAKLLASVSGLPLGFILTDTDDTIITINTAAQKILRLVQLPTHIQHLESHMNNIIQFRSVIEQCKHESRSQEFKEVDWQSAILHLTVSPIFLNTPQKEYIGCVLLIDDITEAKRLERTKDEFFAIASHELRTPLTAIRGSVSILTNYYADKMIDPDVVKMISFIRQSSERLIEIVNEFLNVSRLEQGRIVFKMEEFTIEQTISEVINELKNLADRKQIFLKYDNTVSLKPVHADKERVKQILINLIGNAIKFTTEGGVSVQTREQDSQMHVSITDTGSGIPKAAQGLLFKKFQQADADIFSHDASKGTGLGLYISRKLIENMGGAIFLEHSEEGKGSVFTFTVPLAIS